MGVDSETRKATTRGGKGREKIKQKKGMHCESRGGVGMRKKGVSDERIRTIRQGCGRKTNKSKVWEKLLHENLTL